MSKEDNLGQKVHPYGLRLGYNKTWKSRWYAQKDYSNLLHEDLRLKKELKKQLGHAGVSNIEIERPGNKIRITIHTSRPGIIIGRKGSEIDKLKADLQKRMKEGFDLTAAYTFSKMIDDTRQFSSGVGQQNYYDRGAERAISVSDQPQVLAISYVYQLPFGPGRHFLHDSGFVGRVIGGWELSGIATASTGRPVNITVTRAASDLP